MIEHHIQDKHGVLVCTCGLVGKTIKTQESDMEAHMDNVNNQRTWLLERGK